MDSLEEVDSPEPEEYENPVQQKDREDREVGRAVNSVPNAIKTLKRLFYDRPSYTKGDPYETAYKEGQRDVVGYIIECVDLLKGEQS